MSLINNTAILSLSTTVGSGEDAARLARAVVERRLAACVQVEALQASHYRWEGAVCEEPEWRLTLKTLPACLPAVQAFMAEQHPYQLPQLLWQTLEASADYADWVRQEVSVPAV